MIVKKEEEVEEVQLEEVEEEIIEKKEESKRELVVPGEVIKTGDDFLPGDGTRREKDKILASKFGLAEVNGRLVRIIPLSGIYMPRRGNVVIGRITDVTFNGWLIDINSPYNSFLPVSECPRYINKNDLTEHFNFGEILACKVSSVKHRGIDLTIKGRGLGKLEEGILIHINSNKIPRVIGKEGSMIRMIKEATNCDIIAGQNGSIWIKGSKLEDELLAKKAIIFITQKSFIEGLTDKVKAFLDKEVKKK
ncbi:MAG: exosome complex RNA-binding protein Rrp4 [archaeon]